MPGPSSNSSLPSPRDLLTSLFNSLPQTTPLPPQTGASNSNPLKTLGAAHRSLLVTLHVLFPSLLLQALDLLDRGLVTHVTQATPSSGLAEAKANAEAEAGEGPPTLTTAHLPVTNEAAESGHGERYADQDGAHQKRPEGLNTIYLVRSAQSTHPRNASSTTASSSSSSRYNAAQGQSYIVRLHAWNCTCAAFAFSAFPASTSSGTFSAPDLEGGAVAAPSSPSLPSLPPPSSSRARPQRDIPQPNAIAGWEFGGVSFDVAAVVPPCCKHLLACVLAERWEGVVGSYVRRVRVGREEMAGLGA